MPNKIFSVLFVKKIIQKTRKKMLVTETFVVPSSQKLKNAISQKTAKLTI